MSSGFYKILDLHIVVTSDGVPKYKVILFQFLVVPILGIVLTFRSKILSMIPSIQVKCAFQKFSNKQRTHDWKVGNLMEPRTEKKLIWRIINFANSIIFFPFFQINMCWVKSYVTILQLCSSFRAAKTKPVTLNIIYLCFSWNE